jgi:predicted DNA-binding transcriptional regulator AlpA
MPRKAIKAAKARARRRPISVPSTVIWNAELAARWNLSKPTLWRYVCAGKVPPRDFRIGDREGWKRATIEQFEQAGALQP